MAGVGGGSSKSASQTDSVQGLSRVGKAALEPVALLNADRANNLSHEYALSDPRFFQGLSGGQIAGTDPNTGLASGATQWMTPFANQEAAKYSAGGSLRGQWSPENTQNIIGGTLTGMAGQLIPMAQDWQKYTSALPESLKNSRLNFYNATTGANTGLLGGAATGQSNASSWNANAQVGGSSGTGTATGFFG